MSRADDLPAVLVLAGTSMAPGLRAGFRLRVVPRTDLPAPGDVVVLRSGAAPPAPAFVVHRLVWLADVAGRPLAFHRGDAGGRVGLAALDAVVGRAVAVLDPPGGVPALRDLAAPARRAFERAQRRCRRYVSLHSAGARLGLARLPALRALARRLVLRA